MPDNLEESILENAKRPASAASDGVSVTQHNLKDQIEVDKHLSAKQAVTKPNRGLRFNKLVPPGAE